MELCVLNHHRQKIPQAARGFPNCDKNWQIGIGEARAPLAGSIAGSENSHNPRHGQSRRSIDPQHLSSRIAAEHHRSMQDRKSTRLNSSHANISYAVFCLKKKKKKKKK